MIERGSAISKAYQEGSLSRQLGKVSDEMEQAAGTLILRFLSINLETADLDWDLWRFVNDFDLQFQKELAKKFGLTAREV